MIPIGAIAGAAAAAARANRSTKPVGQGAPAGTPPSSGPEPWAVELSVPVLVWLLVPFAMVVCLVVAAPLLWPLLPLGVVALAPWGVARWLLVPLGRYKLAYYVGSLSTVVWRRDRRGGGLVASSWALLRKKDRTPADYEWIESRMPGHQRKLLPSTLLAMGILAIARGDRAAARQLLGAIELFDPRLAPPLARKLAREWLVADACATGDWARADELAHEPAVPKTESTLFAGAVAHRLRRRPDAPSDGFVWGAWLISRGKRDTLPMVRKATEPQEPKAPSPAPSAAAPALEDPLARALAMHVATLSAPKPGRYDLMRLCAAWDAAIESSATQARIALRAQIVGASSPETARTRMAESIRAEIAAVAREHEVPVGDAGDAPTFSAVARIVRDQLLSEVELASEALGRRARDRRMLPPTDEVREWLALKAMVEKATAIGGPEVRRLIFGKVHTDLCALAVWLFNDRGQRSLGNAVFRWLLVEATANTAAEAVTLQTKNVACGFF